MKTESPDRIKVRTALTALIGETISAVDVTEWSTFDDTARVIRITMASGQQFDVTGWASDFGDDPMVAIERRDGRT